MRAEDPSESAPDGVSPAGADARVPGTQAPSRDIRVPASVLVGRASLLAVAAAALAAALILSRARDRERKHARDNQVAYLCPMHTEVVSAEPGDCPICGMALEKARSVQPAGTDPRNASSRVVTVARRTVTQVIRAPAWAKSDGTVLAILYRDEAALLTAGEMARFLPRATPAAGREVSLSSDPPVRWDDATVKVGFRMRRDPLPQATAGWIEIAARPRDVLVVPESAVLYAGSGAYLLAASSDDHTFRQRPVQVGRTLDAGYLAALNGGSHGAIVVLGGLREGERIIATDAFFLDAELRLQAAQGRPAEVLE